MSNVTKSDLDRQAAAVFRMLGELGVDVSNYRLVHGSKTYGNAYALVDIDPKTGGRRTLLYLGFTRSEASFAMGAFVHGIYFVESNK